MAELLYECVMSLFASLCFGIIFQISGRKLLFSAFGGMLGWLIYALSGILFSASSIPCYFLAAIGITFYSEYCARSLRAPVTIFLAVSLIPLVPGGGIYQTMLYCIQHSTTLALYTGIHTVGIAGALALGIGIVSSVFTVLLRS
ncbi:MAG: threonine/serine exporter family protein [Butyricicoccus sp.]